MSLFNSSQCDTNSENTCLNKVYYQTYLSKDFINNICLPLCPLECNLTEYKYALSSSQLIGDWFLDKVTSNANLAADFVTKPINGDTVKNSIVRLYVFYSSLSYTISTESSRMDIPSLLSSFGGTLGLFLGVSVFSLLEIFEVLIEIYFIKKKIQISAALL